MNRFLLPLIGMCVAATAALAQINVGSDGSDGAFSPTSNITINLNEAAVGNWSDASPVTGKGIYDPTIWAVVFKYSSVNIPSNVTVTFTNRTHGNPPVVWLVQGSVSIAGTVNLNGQNYQNANISRGGPGGFAGGSGNGGTQFAGPGFGPGGGRSTNEGRAGGSFGGLGSNWNNNSAPVMPVYGTSDLIPLIGGSGGSGDLIPNVADQNRGGGGGGGAILIAAAESITVPGFITSNGGTGLRGAGGSGGGVRLVADQFIGSIRVRALGGINAHDAHLNVGLGGLGRIRIEANDVSLASPDINPGPSFGPVGPIFPPAHTPRVEIAYVGDVPSPADPRGNIALADFSTYPNNNDLIVEINAFHVPESWTVQLLFKPRVGADSVITATRIGGNDTASVYQATVPNVPLGNVALQVRASAP
jgi:hypothetical protein